MNKTILITGSGVLGAYLSLILLKKNYRVIVTSRYKKKNYKNYNFLKISKKVKFIKLNILNKKNIERVIDNYCPSKIFYFSGQSSLTKSLKFKKLTYESNFLGAQNFLEVLKKKKSKIKFFKANSGYIFNPQKGKIKLSSKFSKSKNPYIKTQIKAYKIVKKFRSEGLNSYSIIFLQIESPLRDKDFFIKKVCLNAKLGKKIKVGNIDTIRDYSWAPEIATGIYYFSQTEPSDIILSSGKGISGKKVLELAYSKKKIKFENYYKINKSLLRKNEIKVLVGSNKNSEILKKKFNWSLKTYGSKIVSKMYELI